MTRLDETRPLRDDDAVQLDNLRPWLEANAPEVGSDISIEQFPGGHSNLTFLLRTSDGREYVLRRPPMGLEIRSAHDMGREYRILSHLQGVYDKIPRTVAFCDDRDVIGGEFYIMERLQGIVLRSPKLPDGLNLDADAMRTLSTNVIDNLAAIHAVDYEAAGLGDLGRPAGYIERQVTGWTKRYNAAQTDDIPDVEVIATWLDAHRPSQESGAALIHGDYKYDNLLLDPEHPTEIRAVFDWEMATIGDPLMDLGTSLSLWVDPDDPPLFRMLPFGPTMLPGNLNRLELAERYASTSGRTVDDLVFFYVFGLFKMAVVLQQIYKRYTLGHSKDPRFAQMIHGVRAFADMGRRAIEANRIDRLG
ncbi:MAG: phosphotransferase family protein [Candidatus Dadabacteria bacterium]|nr:MAG: phosphotransferase family protein [Candidatus Dadabacteria bacterium]